MKIFKITDKYSIAQYDTRNWVINRLKDIKVSKRKDNNTDRRTSIYGFYPTLESAKKELVELIGKEIPSFKELEKWVNKIKEI